MGCSGSKTTACDAASEPLAAPAQAPPALQGDLQVTLVRTAGTEVIGVSIASMDDGVICIHAVKEAGLVPEWNMRQAADSDKVVRDGDYIIDVNGVNSDAYLMRQELLDGTKLIVALKRPVASGDGCAACVLDPIPAEATRSVSEEEAAAAAALGAQEKQAAKAEQQADMTPIAVSPAGAPLEEAEGSPATLTAADAEAACKETHIGVVAYGDSEAEAARDARLCQLSLC
eukprot:TRINITY_DN21322_c0_g1_i1.p1 TRINITY_DN21322_c0_g1~~TRINITY_DN21322_c0_g1_i1.p1  ORF type:complete len:256 (-),score=67.98 TRINITY_DN21322_c0_g1_i1:208-897(-)